MSTDQDKMTIVENYWNNFNNHKPEPSYAEKEGFKISEIVLSLVRRGGGNALYFNHQIEWDMSLAEAKEEAAIKAVIPEGWDMPITDSDNIDIQGEPRNNQYEITVFIYKND